MSDWRVLFWCILAVAAFLAHWYGWGIESDYCTDATGIFDPETPRCDEG